MSRLRLNTITAPRTELQPEIVDAVASVHSVASRFALAAALLHDIAVCHCGKQ